MKLQFSLATLLVCMTVVGVVCAVAAAIPVYETSKMRIKGQMPNFGGGSAVVHETVITNRHAPTAVNVAWRLSWSAPPALAATLAALWLIRRLRAPKRTPVE